jgi:hypothetical protein
MRAHVPMLAVMMLVVASGQALALTANHLLTSCEALLRGVRPADVVALAG